MKNNYYPIDFQAQYQDQETEEKILQIAMKYKDVIVSTQTYDDQKLKEKLQQVQNDIEQKNLQFNKSSIYSQYASGQLMAERRKNMPQNCVNCGDELKKTAQCQFCAQIFCRKCCSRNRIIPFHQQKQIRLCCEECHLKYIRLFLNKQFYDQKQKLSNAIKSISLKYGKISDRLRNKITIVQDYKNSKRQDKIKQKNLQSKLIQEQKKIKILEQEFRKAVEQKAKKIRQKQQQRKKQEQRRKQEEKQKQKIIENQRLKKQNDENNKIIQQQPQIKKQQVQIKKQQRQHKIYKQRIQKINSIDKVVQNKVVNKQKQSFHNQNSEDITPKQSLGNNSEQRQKFIDTADSKSVNRSRKVSSQISQKKQGTIKSSTSNDNINQLLRIDSTKSANLYEKQVVQQKKENYFEPKKENIIQDALERSLAKMFNSKQQQDNKSMSNLSKAKSVLDMSVNQLLGARLTVPRQSYKIQNQQKPPLVGAVSPILPIIVDKPNVQVVQTNQQDFRISRQNILRNSSLISSSNKVGVPPQQTTDAPDKCTCQIM